MDFVVLADHKLRINVIKKLDNYFHLTRKSWNRGKNMKVAVISVVNEALEALSKDLKIRLDELEIEEKLWPSMIMITIIHPGKWDAQHSLSFWDTSRSSNLGQTTRPSSGQQRKENLPNGGLCRSGWPQGKTERKRKKR